MIYQHLSFKSRVKIIKYILRKKQEMMRSVNDTKKTAPVKITYQTHMKPSFLVESGGPGLH